MKKISNSQEIKMGWILFLLLVPFVMSAQSTVLDFSSFRHHVDYFNSMEEETTVQAIPNEASAAWMEKNIPLFDCPDKAFEEMYYYRWWTLRKHIKETPQGHVLTEFLVERSYSDKYNLISSALGHHIYESRWLRDQSYMNENLNVWYRGNDGKPLDRLRFYSSWNMDAVYNRYLVHKDEDFIREFLPDLIRDYHAWEEEKRDEKGLFWQFDVRDAMEETISGGRHEKNPRPSINGYMYGNAKAIATMAGLLNKGTVQKQFERKADSLKYLVQQELWNGESGFFQVKKEAGDTLSNAMEEIGFIPWYFNLPDAEFSVAWSKLMNSDHFNAPVGITTADRSHPAFRSHGCCKCEWDGAVWPYATAQTLTAMANLLNNYKQLYVTREDYFVQLEKYVRSQRKDGKPYIGEYIDENTGAWLTADERGRYYNHSTFNDLIITGLVGLRPRPDNIIEVNPLLPAEQWDWFCLDNVPYHGKNLTIIWDKTGEKYGKGKGLSVWADGQRVARSKKMKRLIGKM